MKSALLSAEPTLRRMLIRFAYVISLLLVSTQLALLFHPRLGNTLALLALASVPACGLLFTEVAMTRKVNRMAVEAMSEVLSKDLPETPTEQLYSQAVLALYSQAARTGHLEAADVLLRASRETENDIDIRAKDLGVQLMIDRLELGYVYQYLRNTLEQRGKSGKLSARSLAEMRDLLSRLETLWQQSRK